MKDNIMKLFNKKLITLCFALFPLTSMANYSMSPVKLIIKNKQKITSMRFKSNEPTAKTFQVSVYEIVDNKNGESYKPSKEVFATPRVFRTKPGENTQLLRVLAKNRPNGEARKYKLSIKEIEPKIIPGKGAQVAMIPEFRLPLVVEQ